MLLCRGTMMALVSLLVSALDVFTVAQAAASGSNTTANKAVVCLLSF